MLADLVREGKVRYIGHSNLAGWQIAEAHYVAAERSGIPFVSAQNHYSLLARAAEREVLPAVERFGLGFFPFFPLHNGLLTGKFTRDHAPADSRIMRQRQHVWQDAPWDALERFQAFCDERGITMLEATFGWLLARPALSSVIAGATSAEQVRANAAAATAWTPTPRISPRSTSCSRSPRIPARRSDARVRPERTARPTLSECSLIRLPA